MALLLSALLTACSGGTLAAGGPLDDGGKGARVDFAADAAAQTSWAEYVAATGFANYATLYYVAGHLRNDDGKYIYCTGAPEAPTAYYVVGAYGTLIATDAAGAPLAAT